eukprot:1095397-Karenia_brevis.AAC.1
MLHRLLFSVIFHILETESVCSSHLRKTSNRKLRVRQADVLAGLIDAGEPDRVSDDEEDTGTPEPDGDSDEDEFPDMQMAVRSSLSPEYF